MIPFTSIMVNIVDGVFTENLFKIVTKPTLLVSVAVFN